MNRVLVLIIACAAGLAMADRVTKVRDARSTEIKALFEKAGVSYPPAEVYLRVFKQEQQVELWAANTGKELVLVKSYEVCAASGDLGPKRKEGDLQVPEGLYEVSEYNPTSSYHLALKVSYPNASDRVRSDKKTPGGLIYLHGKCASIGCIAITDTPVEEVYLAALDAKKKPVRIDIFPTHLTPEFIAKADEPNHSLWNELLPALTEFDRTHHVPSFTVDSTTGAYRVRH